MSRPSVPIQYQSPPFGLKARSSKWAIACAAFGACFTDGFLYGAVVPVLPFSLTERSNIPEEQVQFWVSLLLAVFGSFLALGAPLAGWAADRGARSTPFLWGLVLATISTLTFCLARAPAWLVLARVLQGLAASVIYTAGLSLVTDAVGPDEVGTWIGFVFSGMTFGLLVSPFIAGIVYDHAGYYAVFGTIFGILGLDFLLRTFMIEKREAIKYLPEEQKSTISADADPRYADETVSHHSVASINSRENCHSPTGQVVRREEIQGTPPGPDEHTTLLPGSSKKPKSWFRRTFPKFALLGSSPRLIAAVYGCFTNMMLYACLDAVLPLFVKRVFDWTAKGAGSIFLTVSCPSLFGPLFGALADRYGPRIVSLTGLILTGLSTGLMALVKEDSIGEKVLLCVFLVFVGIGLNLILAPLAADVFAAVGDLTSAHPEILGTGGAYGQAYSLMTISFGVGTALGPVVAGALYEKTNWPITVGVLAITCVPPCVMVFLYTGDGRRSADKK